MYKKEHERKSSNDSDYWQVAVNSALEDERKYAAGREERGAFSEAFLMADDLVCTALPDKRGRPVPVHPETRPKSDANPFALRSAVGRTRSSRAWSCTIERARRLRSPPDRDLVPITFRELEITLSEQPVNLIQNQNNPPDIPDLNFLFPRPPKRNSG